MPSETGAAPSIDDFITRNFGPCTYMRDATPEQREEIEHHPSFATDNPKWTAYSRWLESQGVTVRPENIKQHYVRHLDGH